MNIIRRSLLALVLMAGITPVFAQAPSPVPALPDSERRTSYSISASTCACAVGFQLYGDSTDYQNWLEVFVNGVLMPQSGNWTVTSPSGSLAALPRPISDAVLTFTAAQTGAVQIVGARRPRRVSQFSENTGVPARALNQALTDIIAQNRENWDKTNDVTGRAALAPPGETLALLPVLASRQNMGACFDSGGNLKSCVSVPSTTITAGNGISFTGTNPTTIKSNIQAGRGVAITGTSLLTVAYTGRVTLSVATTFYVDRTSGTDVAGCGLTSGGGACQSVQYLVNILLAGYDFGAQNVTIQLANSAFNYAPFQVGGPWVGLNSTTFIPSVVIVGNTATPSSVIIDGASGGYCVQATEYAAFVIRGVQIQNCALGLAAPEQHAQLYFDHITWSSMPAGSIGIYASRQSYVEAVGGGNTINSVGAYFVQATHQGNFRASAINTGAFAFTLGANITMTNGDFAYTSSDGDITFTQYTASAFNLNGFTATGVRWGADSGGIYQVLNASTGKSMMPTFFLGSSPGGCIGDCLIDQAGHSPATVTGCGTGGSVFGNDFYGTVTEGTTATGCNVVFNSAFSAAPFCQVTWLGVIPATVAIASNTAQLALTHASASGSVFTYSCKGY